MSDASGGTGFPKPPSPPPPPNMAAPPVPYGAAQRGAFASFRRIGGVSKALRVLILSLIPVLALSAFLMIAAKGKADDFIAGVGGKQAFTDVLATYALVGILAGLLQLALFVLTIVWMFRMAKNQLELRRAGTWGPGWAVAGWFLPPFILYVLPYLMLRDLWKASDPQSGPDWKRNPVGFVVHLWWALFGLAPLAFISVTFGNLRFNANPDNLSTARGIVDVYGTTLAAAAVQVAAAVAYFVMVKQLSARHMQTTDES